MQSLDIEQLAFLIAAARAFEAEDLKAAREPVTHRGNDGEIEVMRTSEENLAGVELRSFIDALSDEQKIEVLALARMGREIDENRQWRDVLAQAQAVQAPPTADSLLGMPMLAKCIEEGLSKVDPDLSSVVDARVASYTGAS